MGGSACCAGFESPSWVCGNASSPCGGSLMRVKHHMDFRVVMCRAELCAMVSCAYWHPFVSSSGAIK